MMLIKYKNLINRYYVLNFYIKELKDAIYYTLNVQTSDSYKDEYCKRHSNEYGISKATTTTKRQNAEIVKEYMVKKELMSKL